MDRPAPRAGRRLTVLSVAEARARILAGLSPVSEEVVGLAEAHGRVLAVPVTARLTQPPADISAMDGYAVRAAEALPGATLALAGTAQAGHPFAGVLPEGGAVRVFTGSVMPQGADAVLVQEDAAVEAAAVASRVALTQGQHIRRAGQDFAAGDLLLAPGRRLGARDIGLAAAANHPWVRVHRRPRVAVLATGDEVAMPGEPVGPGGIVGSNSYMLAALIRGAGADPVLLPVAADSMESLAEAARAAANLDFLVTTGGASVGDHDLVRAGLAAQGLVLDFWRIAMRPGKPMLFGRMGAMPVLGLPGNPVSAFVCAVLFLLPALARLAGLPAAAPRTERARLGAALPANDGRADHLRALLAEYDDGVVATAFPRQDSGMLGVLARAGALILRAPHAPALAEGAAVEVIRLDRLGW